MYLISGEAEGNCGGLNPSLLTPVSIFALFSVALFLGELCLEPMLVPGSSSQSTMKWFLPWRFSSRFLELARLPGTAAVSSPICIYCLFLLCCLGCSPTPCSCSVPLHLLLKCNRHERPFGRQLQIPNYHLWQWDAVHCEMKKSQTCYSSHCVRSCSRPLHPIRQADMFCKVWCPFSNHSWH